MTAAGLSSALTAAANCFRLRPCVVFYGASENRKSTWSRTEMSFAEVLEEATKLSTLRKEEDERAVRNGSACYRPIVVANDRQGYIETLGAFFAELTHIPCSSVERQQKISQLIREWSADNCGISGQHREDVFESTALAVLTSGTTGESKLACLAEEALLANAISAIRHHDLQCDDVILTAMPISHVNALCFSILCSFLSGAKLVLMRNFSPRGLAEICSREKVTVVSTMAPQLKALLESGAVKSEDFRTVKYFKSAATSLPKEIVERFLERFQRRILPGYGLSEATNFSCILPVDLSDSQYRAAFSRASVSPIGAAIPEATISIRNGSEIVQGEGVEGEICVSGPHLMNGYLTGVQPISEGVLRTGDLGLYFDFEFGRIFYLTGRLKEVVKRSGVSISLREIDDILIPHLPPGIDLASVGFENDYTGEEIGLAVEVAGQLDRGRIVDLLVKACSLLPFETRPKVLVMIQSGGPAMRTESGKPLRRNFVQYFSNFKTQILTGGIRVVDLVSS